MDKTLHQKLSGNTAYTLATKGLHHADESLFISMVPEMKILQQAAKELLTPRSEAISRILQLSRDMN